MSLFCANAAPPGHPYWWDNAPPPPELPESPPAQAEMVVIGAGYTGLSAAITAADAGVQVVVLDAGQPGQGASTRNGGMFGAHPRLPHDTMVSRFGEQVARGLFDEAPMAFGHTAGLIEAEGIDCDFQRTGRIQLAYTRADHAVQQRLVQAVGAGEGAGEMRIVPPEAVRHEIGSALYQGGLLFPGHAALHPRKFHDGLMAAALRRGVQVVPACAVTGFDWRGPGAGHDLRTSLGPVRAGRVVLATNGYTTGAFPWVRHRVFALPSYIIATQPLDPALIASLAPGRRMMVETRARHSYYRISPDGSRILFGGRAAMVPVALPRAAARLHATMCQIWPELRDVRLSHVWSGNTGYSFSHMPHLGQWQGMHYALGYSGSGVAVAPYLGARAAWAALGDPRGDSAYGGAHLRRRPLLHPVQHPWFLHAADLWYQQVVDRAESWRAARDRRAQARAGHP